MDFDNLFKKIASEKNFIKGRKIGKRFWDQGEDIQIGELFEFYASNVINFKEYTEEVRKVLGHYRHEKFADSSDTIIYAITNKLKNDSPYEQAQALNSLASLNIVNDDEKEKIMQELHIEDTVNKKVNEVVDEKLQQMNRVPQSPLEQPNPVQTEDIPPSSDVPDEPESTQTKETMPVEENSVVSEPETIYTAPKLPMDKIVNRGASKKVVADVLDKQIVIDKLNMLQEALSECAYYIGTCENVADCDSEARNKIITCWNILTQAKLDYIRAKQNKQSSIKKQESIVRRKDGYYVISSKGKNLGGPYDFKERTASRLRQIEYFKNKIASNQDWDNETYDEFPFLFEDKHGEIINLDVLFEDKHGEIINLDDKVMTFDGEQGVVIDVEISGNYTPETREDPAGYPEITFKVELDNGKIGNYFPEELEVIEEG